MARVVEVDWSLSIRLAWRLTGLMLFAIVLAAAAVAWRTIATLHDLDDSALQQQVRLVVTHLPPDDGGHAPFGLPSTVTEPFRLSDGDNLFLVFGRGQKLLTSSDPAKAVQALTDLRNPLRAGFFRVPFVLGHPQGMVGYAQPAGGRWVVVLQGREQTAVLLDSLMAHFLFGALWLLLPIGAATALVSLYTLRRAFKPLLRVSAAAAFVGASRPGLRLPVAGLPREVAPLVTAVNEALMRLEQTIASQRIFMAEAAHGLRTPLAVLTARLDTLSDVQDVDPLRHDVDRMARLVGQLLGMTRLESLPLDVSQEVDLQILATEAVADLVPLALQRNIELALLGAQSAVLVRGHKAALTLAITNLIENAIAYAPEGSTVEIVVSLSGMVAVRDRGPGIAPEHWESLLRPFERGRAAVPGGAGLGLAIVSRIAASHHGTLCLDARQDGVTSISLSVTGKGFLTRSDQFYSRDPRQGATTHD
ncbi:sensor histidine kinase [Acidisoma cladoniae]|uniref:sensor histidine kinase n=1 Tax=Acidisoma cladoniae TaxID=3040935 RepID=UPI00254BE109|nr:ATP-binding protein [Acidisoma sp. PAMC 29798]